MANSSSLTNEVAYKLRYYMDVQRKEDGFDLTGPNSPLSPYSSSNGTKSGSVLNFERLKDRSLKHYFTPQMIRTQITNLEAMPPGTMREREIKKKMKRRVRRSSYEEIYLTNDSQIQSEAYRAQLKALKRMERDTSRRLYKRYNGRSFSSGRTPNISSGESNRIINHASQILVATETVALAQEILNQSHAKQSAKARPQSAPTHRHPSGVLRISSHTAYGTPQRPSTAKARITGRRRKLQKPKYCWDLHGRKVPIVREEEEDFLQDLTGSSYSSSSSLDIHHLSPNYSSEVNRRNRPMSAKGSRTLPHVQQHDSRNRPLSADVIYIPHTYQHPVPPQHAYAHGAFSVDISTQTTEDVGSQTEFQHGQRRAWSVISKYNIKIWTGDRSGASTRAEVYVVLVGSKGKTEEHFLTKTESGSRPFRRGEADEFVIETHDIGDLKSIGIGHDQKEKDFSWYVDHIEVREGSDTFKVSCNKWFSGKNSDKKTFRYFDVKLLVSESSSDTSSQSSKNTVDSRSSTSTATQSSVARRKSEDSSHSSMSKASSKSSGSSKRSVSSRDSASGRRSRLRVHAKSTTTNRSNSSSSSSESESEDKKLTVVHFEKKKQRKSKVKPHRSNKERVREKSSDGNVNSDGLIAPTKAALVKSKLRDSSSIDYSSDSSIMQKEANAIAAAPVVESNVELSADSSVKVSGSSSSSSDSESTLSTHSRSEEEKLIPSKNLVEEVATKPFVQVKSGSGSDLVSSSSSSSGDSSSDTDTVQENTKDKELEIAVEIAPPAPTVPEHSTASFLKEFSDKNETDEETDKKESIFSFFTSKKDSTSESSESDMDEAVKIKQSQNEAMQGNEVATGLDLTVATNDKALDQRFGDFASTEDKMYPKSSSESSSSSSEDSGSESEDEKVEENFNQNGKRLSIASLVNEHPTKLSMVGTFEEDRQEMADVKEVEEPALAEVQEVRKLEVLEAEVHREKGSSSDDGSTLSIDRISSGTELSSSSSSESDKDEARTPTYGVPSALVQESHHFENITEPDAPELTAPPPAYYVEPNQDQLGDKLKEFSEVPTGIPFSVTVDERQSSSSSSSESEEEKGRVESTKETFEMQAPPPAEYIIPEQVDLEGNQKENAEIAVAVSRESAESGRKSSSSSSSSSSDSEEEETVEDILSKGVDIHKAILDDNFDRVKELIAKVPHVKGELNEKGWAPMHEAAAFGRLRILKWLTSNNVDVNSETQTGYTAMHVAAMNGHVNCMMVLKSFGVSIESRNVDGQTPLHLAAMGGQLDVVKWLVVNGGNHRTKDNNGRSARDFATHNHHKAVLDFLQAYAKKMKTLGGPGSSSESSSSSSSSSSSESEQDEVSPLASESHASLMKHKEEEDLEEKKRMFREQQEKMLKRKSSFLEEIRMEAEQEYSGNLQQ